MTGLDKIKVFFVFCLLLAIPFPASATTYESLGIINAKNWAAYIGDHLGYLYDSHGCLHFTPSDIFLLTRTIPQGIPLKIWGYGQTTLPAGYAAAPYFHDLVNSSSDVRRYAVTFQQGRTRLEVYPGLGRLFIIVNDSPFAQVKTRPGPKQFYLQACEIAKRSIVCDFTPNTPTDAGDYKILRSTSHYISPTYYDLTVVPFGAWIEKQGDAWVFQDGKQWYQLPQVIGDDLDLPYGRQDDNYYDINTDADGKITAARWGNQEFGKYALLWTKDGKTSYPELGYSEGQLLFEQTMLVKALASLLTAPGADSFEALINDNEDFRVDRDAYDFIDSSGEVQPDSLDPVSCSYVRLFNGWRLGPDDRNNVNPDALKTFNDYRAGRMPWLESDRRRMVGIYNYIRDTAWTFDKWANWYVMVRNDWPFFGGLRAKLRGDLDRYGIYAPANRQMVLEQMLSDRLEFRLARLPVKSQLTYSKQFDQAPETRFTRLEKAAVLDIIRSSSGETPALPVESVRALNDYNFGVLLNDMLGSLYRSHGCLHMSPRNIYIANQLLPIGAPVIVKSYKEKADLSYDQLPPFASLVNFTDDLEALAPRFADPASVTAAVYPASGLWVVYLAGKPYAKIKIETGPSTAVELVQGRDSQGKPIFETDIAYPTSAATFYVFKKLVNYVSNLYHDTTVIPQNALMKKTGDKWAFKDLDGRWEPVPDSVAADLNAPAERQLYSYFGTETDESGALVGANWGSNEFGRYPIQLSRDKRTPAPELAHTSGDLMMEQRGLIRDLIKVLAAPKDKFEDCIKYSSNFDLYLACYNFLQSPDTPDLIEPLGSASYKLNRHLPLTEAETAAIPQDVFVAYKVVGKVPLNQEESNLLVSEGIARWQGSELKIDRLKIDGLIYDVYEYVISIKKNANIYSTLKSRWAELAPLRQAFLHDLNKFKISDPDVFQSYVRELILKRTELERLTQDDAYQVLNSLLVD